MQPALKVLFILAVVLVAALAFQPKSFIGHWRKLSELYGTPNSPRRITFPDEHLLVGKIWGGSFFRGRSDGAEYARFDVELDNDGLWLVYDGPAPVKCAPQLFVPGTHVRYVKDKNGQYDFLIHADKPIPLRTAAELGEAIKRKATMAPIEPS